MSAPKAQSKQSYVATLIIITWNKHDKLVNCLQSLTQNCDLSAIQVVIIDNGSTDGTHDLLSKNYNHFKLIFKESNLGVAPARNLGVRMAEGRYVIFLDDDIIVHDDFIKSSLDYLEDHPDVSILGPRLLFENGEVQPSARTFPNLRGVLGRGLPKLLPRSFSNDYLNKYLESESPIEVEWVIGACQFIRRELFDTVGLLDERYFFGYEDVDFCHSASKQGVKTVYHPGISLQHLYQRRSAKGLFSMNKYHHILSILKYFWKTGLRL